MIRNKLATFVFTRGDKVISPPLVTVREYARWLETTYDEYTCNYELYLRSTLEGMKVLEFHPGTRIGQYFDTTKFNADRYNSWYIYQDSTMMQKLVKLRLAEYKDIAQVQSGDKRGLRLLRLYSVDQIELYIRTKIDRNFSITDKIMSPKKIVLRRNDMEDLIPPNISCNRRKSLLDDAVVSMTVNDIEKKLGHKISIVSERSKK